jgi:ribosome-associated toxin RatA of RatAB toxin-antitoxin module
MQFEFESILTRKLIGSVFEQLVGSQINAFEKRAKNLYDVD